MKRIIVCLLCIALMSVVFMVGCSKDGSNADTTGANANTSDALSEESVWDSIVEIEPGVAWSDLVEETLEPAGTDTSDVTDDMSGLDTLFNFPESGIELPRIPLP